MYEKLDAVKTLLYSYISADDVAAALSTSDDDDDSAPYYFPPEIVGMGIINVRCVILENNRGKISSIIARARWGSVMVSRYTPNLINAVEKEAEVNRQTPFTIGYNLHKT